MKNLFKEEVSEKFIAKYAASPKELALRVYTSRLIGSNRNLVLHGGGNTSVKLRLKNIVGEETNLLFVKASGLDLSTIEPEGFVGLELNPLQKLRGLESLSDKEMENQLSIHRINSKSALPSVETLLHAFLPHQYIDHTHADSILILTNLEHGEDLLKKALGKKIAVVPYAKSGLPLAKTVVAQYESQPDIEAIIVLYHGIFTFADDARTSYGNMIRYVTRAESYIEKKTKNKTLMAPRKDLALPSDAEGHRVRCAQIIRGACAHPESDGRLKRLQVVARNSSDLIAVSVSKKALTFCRSGVLTPDHVIRTKNAMVYIESVPESEDDLKKKITTAVKTYIKDYHHYFETQIKLKEVQQTILDPYPSLFLVTGLGLFAIGVSQDEAQIAADIGEHTIRAKLRADAIGKYVSIPESHVFDMEYWSLQQQKLTESSSLPLMGQVAVITGGGGAIGCGIADRLLSAGAAVAISDIDLPRLQKAHALLTEKYDSNRVQLLTLDVTDIQSVENAYTEICRRFGGVDIVVPNAGIAHVAKIQDLNPDVFDRVLAVNLKGTFTIIKAAVPIFKRQGTGGNIVVISSKNVFDPGAAFGAYSASKAAAHQIAKIAAMELAEIGVRVNMINPDAIFGDDIVSSKLWELVGPERMKSRGLDAEGLKEYYRQRSLLKVPVLAEHVGNAVVFFASELTPTTGATLPVDGGNPAAFPR
ncbi:MAG: bifunctional aldolase/short-chain dehydrogenase [Deltaproteobacteria bacterium]|nr:MAG: bifunctional aldolase/short-chain dehydrogenase [Deltaproteobacteria bacterium]